VPSHVKGHFVLDIASYCKNRPCFLQKKKQVWFEHSSP